MNAHQELQNIYNKKKASAGSPVVLLRKLLPKWSDAFSSGQKLVDLVSYKQKNTMAMQ